MYDIPISGPLSVKMRMSIQEARGFKVSYLYRYSNNSLIPRLKSDWACVTLWLSQAAHKFGLEFTPYDGCKHAWIVLKTKHHNNQERWFCIVMKGNKSSPEIEFDDFDGKEEAISHGFAEVFGIFEMVPSLKEKK